MQLARSRGGKPPPQVLIPAGVLVSSVGGGMYLLAVGVIFYDKFGGATAFAWLPTLQSIAVVVTQLVASVASDSGHAQAIASRAEFVRGSVVTAAAVATSFGHPEALAAAGVALALVQPFHRTPMFALAPLIAQGDALARYSARITTFLQTGQVIGAAVAGPLIMIDSSLPLYLNGASYLFSGFMVAISDIPQQARGTPWRLVASSIRPASVSRSWLEGLRVFWATQLTLRLTILCAFDFLVIGWLNTIYAPLLTQWDVDTTWVSWWDGAFAIGALAGANLAGRWNLLRRGFTPLFVILVLEGVSAGVVGYTNAYLLVLVMLLLGLINAASIALFSFFIQTSSQVEMVGRAAGLRQLSIAGTSVIALPGLSVVATRSVADSGTWLCCLMVLVSVSGAVLLRGRRLDPEQNPPRA